jgi:hypothetical protein
MLTTGAATAIALTMLVASSLIGLAVGFIVCLVFRLTWNVKVAALDLLIALATSIASVYLFALIAYALGYDSVVSWVFLTASAMVVLRHLARLMRRRRACPTSDN